MDFFAGQGARRRHSPDYGNDEQRRHAKKDAVLCFDISDSRHYYSWRPAIPAPIIRGRFRSNALKIDPLFVNPMTRNMVIST
jgi:hypothetical protein